MSIDTATVTADTVGEDSQTDGPVVVPAGTYKVGAIDPGEYLGLILDETAPCDTTLRPVVWVPADAVGLVACLECGGRGEWSYMVAEDDWDTEHCEGCDHTGLVTPDVHDQQADDERDRLDHANSGDRT